jgi:hypothetical protein
MTFTRRVRRPMAKSRMSWASAPRAFQSVPHGRVGVSPRTHRGHASGKLRLALRLPLQCASSPPAPATGSAVHPRWAHRTRPHGGRPGRDRAAGRSGHLGGRRGLLHQSHPPSPYVARLQRRAAGRQPLRDRLGPRRQQSQRVDRRPDPPVQLPQLSTAADRRGLRPGGGHPRWRAQQPAPRGPDGVSADQRLRGQLGLDPDRSSALPALRAHGAGLRAGPQRAGGAGAARSSGCSATAGTRARCTCTSRSATARGSRRSTACPTCSIASRSWVRSPTSSATRISPCDRPGSSPSPRPARRACSGRRCRWTATCSDYGEAGQGRRHS